VRAIRPPRLSAGDAVAVVSPSWGGPALYPHIFDAGLRVLREHFGLRVKEYPSARARPDYLRDNPRARADDLNAAFCDPEVHAIVASIGGDDSVRLLPYLDADALRANPKVLRSHALSAATACRGYSIASPRSCSGVRTDTLTRRR